MLEASQRRSASSSRCSPARGTGAASWKLCAGLRPLDRRCRDGYAEVSLSPEFRAVYGDLVNKQMAVRKLVQGEVERFDRPVRHADAHRSDSTARRMQELRREMRALQDASTRWKRQDAVTGREPDREAGDQQPARRSHASPLRASTGQESRCPPFALIQGARSSWVRSNSNRTRSPPSSRALEKSSPKA